MRLQRLRSIVPRFVLVLFASALLVAPAWAQSAAQNAADTELLIKVLEVRAGSVIGEIGAGSGDLSLAIAKAVGESGRVFSNELNPKSLEALRKALDDQGVKNVTVVEGRPLETNFSEGCCDAIFMRNVYHHFGDPPAMNRSLLQSLKPGGRLAVIDFTPPGEEAPPGGRGKDNFHGVTAATVERELREVGFDVVSSTTSNRSITVVAQRPKS